MKIVADENIPLVSHYFDTVHELVLKNGRAINATDVANADILLVRSVTPVNEPLLKNSRVKFVGSTTIGADHLDIEWLESAGIQWAIAKGCNATAVTEYVLCTIAALQRLGYLSAKKLRAGVIGVGTIGSLVVDSLKEIGFDVVVNDPIRAVSEGFLSTPLEEFTDLDFISLHTPLTLSGTHPTFHLIEKEFLQRQKSQCILLNTSRGAVINFEDLKDYGNHLIWCLDVWENEPSIDLDVLNKAIIATPHIAGYSVQSKYRGIELIYQAAVAKGIIPEGFVSHPFPTLKLTDANYSTWQDLVLRIYDPLKTTTHMKTTMLQQSTSFDDLRKNFPERHELAFVECSE